MPMKPLSLLCGALLLAACGSDHSTQDDAVAAGYARLEACDTLNWLGLPDSLSCPRSGGLCPIKGMDKVGTNVCLVGKTAYAYSVVAGVAYGSETSATLNGSRKLLGAGTAELVFDSLQTRNELVVEVEYSTTLKDTSPVVVSKTYRFTAP